jgi:hypothetical protein
MGTPFLFGEIANEASSFFVDLGHDVEQERFYVVIKCLVVQEHLCYQTQVLTIDLVSRVSCDPSQRDPFCHELYFFGRLLRKPRHCRRDISRLREDIAHDISSS